MPPSQPWARNAPAPASRPPVPPRPLHRTTGGKFLLGCGGLAAVLFVAVTFLIIRNLRDPKIVLPTPIMPKPNAFDVYVRAAQQIVRKEEIAAIIEEVLQGKSSSAAKKNLVSANQTALATFRSGLEMNCRSVPIRSAAQEYPPYADFRAGVRLMTWEADIRAKRGDVKGAANAGLDGVTIGKQIANGSPLIGGLVSAALQVVGRRPVWEIYERLNAEQTKAVLQRYQKMQTIKGDYAALLEEERHFMLGEMRDGFKYPNKTASERALEENQDSNAALEATAKRLSLFFYGKQRVIDNLNQGFDEAIARSRKPYADSHDTPRLPSDFFSQQLLPVLYDARIRFVYNDTQDALLITQVALHAYKLDNGRYPETLAALSPRYLKRLSDDPFSRHQPLRYIVARRLLYSIGPDGRDDGGKPINNPEAETPMARRNANADSQGDIVAGMIYN